MVNLTTEELINDLDMTFHAAKRLQLYLLVVKAGKSIYDKLPPVLNWENEKVCLWLSESGFAAHEEKFKTKDVSTVAKRPRYVVTCYKSLELNFFCWTNRIWR